MRKLFISFISALTAVTAAITSITSFALNYRDPNGDGIISLLDSYYINQYLYGKFEPNGYYIEPLDFNENGVVSPLDYELVQVVDAGGEIVKGNAGSINTYTYLQDNNYVDYYVYDAQTGYKKTGYDYVLGPDDSKGNDPDSLNGIMSGDNRVIDWSKNGVVKLILNNGNYVGSGFVVGSNTILTAAHCVMNGSNAKIISSILLFDSYGQVDKTVQPVEIHVPQNYLPNSPQSYDYALITVNQDISNYMCFDLGVSIDYNSNLTLPVTITGFPSGLNYNPNNTSSNHYMYSGNGVINGSTSRTLEYSMYTYGGDSGSPVYVTESSNGYTHNTVVAIHTNGLLDQTYHSGVRINSEILRFAYWNPYI